MSIYEEITNQILADLESAKSRDWQLPWHKLSGLPTNIDTGKSYAGVNILALASAKMRKGYSSSKWGTFKQWQSLDCQVKKGEKASKIIFWSFFETASEEGDESDAHKKIVAIGYCVFNADQVEGYVEDTVNIADANVRDENAETFFTNVGANISHTGDEAYYSPILDKICIPILSKFHSSQGYYATLAHEHVHWTGSKSRLNRLDSSAKFGSESYAAEELVAELGASFLCANLGFYSETRENHVAYIQSWIKLLKNDKRAIFVASSKAQKAVELLKMLQHADEIQVAA